MDFIDVCPPIVVERLMNIDLTSSENAPLFSWVAEQSSLNCQIQSVIVVASKLNANSHPQIISDFCGSVATYSGFFTPLAIDQIKQAYLRVPYYESIAPSYFIGLRDTKIDIRDHIKTIVGEPDWSFTHPRKNAATWHYYLYLASLHEPGAIDALAQKISDTRNGNDATNLLESLSQLKGQHVTKVLKQYENDDRHADGTNSPALKISENVKFWLENRPEK